MFISFEGLDGCGKTTQARLLAEALEADGHAVTRVREPGGTPAGERIRGLLLDPGERIAPAAEALLYAAARAQLVLDVIRPALQRGEHVVADRFIDSSLAYQGVARNLGVDPVLEANSLATGGLMPDRTVLLHPPPAPAARPRAGRRPGGGGSRIASRPSRTASTRRSRGVSTRWLGGFRSGSSRSTPRARPTRCSPASARRWGCERRLRRAAVAGAGCPAARGRARRPGARLPPRRAAGKRQAPVRGAVRSRAARVAAGADHGRHASRPVPAGT